LHLQFVLIDRTWLGRKGGLAPTNCEACLSATGDPWFSMICLVGWEQISMCALG
jgi:hypothetical protein